jgi:hypothetical protein
MIAMVSWAPGQVGPVTRCAHMARTLRSALLGIWVMGILTWCAPGRAAGEIMIDGVPHVRNGAAPTQGSETWKLQEVWRAGGAAEGGLLLGLISDVVADESGNVYVLDSQLCQVHVFSPEGKHLRTLFRQGEGPGELRRPRDVLLTADGVGAAEEFPAKVVMVDRAGSPLPNLPVGGSGPTAATPASLTAADQGGGNLVVSGALSRDSDQPGVEDRTYFLASYDATGAERARYAESHGVYNYNDFVFAERENLPPFWWAFTVAKDGRVWVAPDRDRYAIEIHEADGRLVRVIERNVPPAERTAEEKDRMRRLLEGAMASLPIPYRIRVEDREPVLSFFHRPLHLMSDGTLWVTPTQGVRGQPAGIMWTCDVFDAAGQYVKRVSLGCEGNGYDDCLFFLGQNRFLLVKGYADALAAQFGRGTVAVGEGEEPTVPELVYYKVAGRD